MRRLVNKHWERTRFLGDLIAALLTRTISYRVLSWASGYEVSGAKMYFLRCPVTMVPARETRETIYYEGHLIKGQ